MKKFRLVYLTLLLMLSAGLAAQAQQGTTPGGVQYSTADMSMFTKDAGNGTIALYYGYGSAITSAYVYELVGPKTSGNKADIADVLTKKVSSSVPFIGFEKRSGNCATAEAAIRQKSGTSVSVRCQGQYRGD